MATAIELNSISTVLNGQGLAANANVLSSISTFQSKPTVTIVANIFSSAGSLGSNAVPILFNALNQLGANVTNYQYLLDFYPSNITPVSSGSVTFYGNTNTTASVSNTVKTQVNLPFSHGLAGFANCYTIAFGTVSTVFDHVASVNMLKNKTYADTGLGHGGLADLATSGLSSYGPLIADTVRNWGTMYDITNLNLLDDPYVFGQNLLNQGLGVYGNLNTNLTDAGLDVNDITHIPSSYTTTSHEPSSVPTQSPYGEIQLPTLNTVNTTVTVTGGSPDVIKNIYKQVTRPDLSTIILATGFSSTVTDKLLTLADFLDFTKVVPINLLSQWATLGVKSFSDFGKFLHTKLGSGSFASWKNIALLMDQIEVPVLNHTVTTASSSILSDATISAINSLGTGSGPLNNLTMLDYFSATAGVGYTESFDKINSVYSSIAAPIELALKSLQSAVITWVSGYSPGDPYGMPPTSEVIPDITPVTNAVKAVNTALNSIIATPDTAIAQRLYYSMLDKLTVEVSNLVSAKIKFLSADASLLTSFGQSVVMYATENDQFYSQQVIQNLITNDSYGDTIRAAITEKKNSLILSTAGIVSDNDPMPSVAIMQAKAQNIPLSTYLSRNK